MVRTSGMSRGCKTCRTRKIKCDEKLPHCSQCLKSGRECPGPVSDFIVLEATKSDPRRSRRVENDNPSTGTASRSPPQSIPAGMPSAAESSTSWSSFRNYALPEPEGGTESSIGNTLTTFGQSGLVLDENLASRKNLPSLQSQESISFQPDQVEKFISYFFGAGTSESENDDCMRLRPFIADYPSDPYLQSPLVAAALCLHANSSDDPEALWSAQCAYGSGLRWQQERLAAHKKDSTPVIQDVLSTLMLGYFEMMSCTDPNAYFHHITGAATMLGMVGPQVCSSPPWQPLFRAVRLHMVSYSFKELKNSFLASPEWMTIPFEDRPKAAIDMVLDVLTIMPEALSKSYTDSNPANFEDNVHLDVYKMARMLKDIWHNMRGQIPPSVDQGKGKATQTLPSITHAPCWYYVPKLEEYDENFNGLCIAFYCAAWIALLSRVQESNPNMDREGLIAAHAFDVLQICDRLEESGNGGEFIRMVLPLRVVAMKSPRETQRESARRRLESWRDTRALKGICTIALAN